MRKVMLLWGYLVLMVGVVVAQTGDCERIVAEALGSVDALCEGLDRNNACYGSSVVDREVIDTTLPPEFFTNPGDRSSLVNFSMIQPQPLNAETGEFGVGLLNVLANVPNTVPGQAVLFLLVGDAQLTNEVPSEGADQSAFQSFYFLPGLGDSPCYEADPTLTIQTPGNITTTLYLNGVETEFSPGTLLTITDSVCTIHRGNIIRRTPEGEIAAVLLANETVDIFIDEEGGINVTNKRGISQAEYERGELIQQALNSIAFESSWEAQFLVPPDEFAPEPETQPATQRTDSIATNVDASEVQIVTESSSSSSTADCETQHTVRSGETLHMIADRYDTSVLGISEFNGLENPRVIYPGDTLCIPNVGSGFEPLPAGF